MTGRNVPGTHDAPGGQPAVDLEQAAANHVEPLDVLSSEQVLRLLAEETGDAQALASADGVPQITRMPPGMTVVEHAIGRGVAQWVLQVHCECGRRWYELEEVGFAKCPRCELLLRIEVDSGGT